MGLYPQGTTDLVKREWGELIGETQREQRSPDPVCQLSIPHTSLTGDDGSRHFRSPPCSRQ